jgi:hypothetical protein
MSVDVGRHHSSHLPQTGGDRNSGPAIRDPFEPLQTTAELSPRHMVERLGSAAGKEQGEMAVACQKSRRG